MFFKSLFLSLYLFFFISYVEIIFCIRIKRNNLYNFQNMTNSFNVKNLDDVKEKVKYEKHTYCLLLDKYKVNKILKNKRAKFWLLDIYKFPSVLKYKEYKNCFLQNDHNDKNNHMLNFIYNNYLKKRNHQNAKNESENGNYNNDHNDNQTCNNMNIFFSNEYFKSQSNFNEEDFRLIPLNDFFNKILLELFYKQREESIHDDGIYTKNNIKSMSHLFNDNSPEQYRQKEKQQQVGNIIMCNSNSPEQYRQKEKQQQVGNIIMCKNNSPEQYRQKEKEQAVDNIIMCDEKLCETLINDDEINEHDENKNSVENLCEDFKKDKDDIEIIYNMHKFEYIEELFELIKEEDIKFQKVKLEFGYDNMNTSEILRKIFPSINEIIHKFEIIGHIAHLNFCDKLESCKKIIAEIILDKNKSIKTVINKKDILNNTHRTFNIELLAGENNYVTQLKENNIRVKLNYELIYWNSKLKKERDRIYNLVKDNSIIIDVFGGVGIFSLSLSKKSCLCFSNDINEHAYKYMNINISMNKNKNILTYNMDGREFLEKLFNLKIFSKNNNVLTLYINDQNQKNISLDVLNSKNHILTGNDKNKSKNKNKNKNHIQNNNTCEKENNISDRKCPYIHNDNNQRNITCDHNNDQRNITCDNNNNNNNINVSGNNSIHQYADMYEHKFKYQKIREENIDNSKNEENHKIDINLNIYEDIHILMNLPQTALEFLNVFKKYKKEKNDELRNVFIHCYYFAKPEFFYEHAEKNILLHFNQLPKDIKITEIRKVSPSKLMYVVEFNLKDLL
ncbi:met-10+ like protein, putative [Plasmodium reichenowi]|uniref:tRNA (guanine(37)-N1)-methyltransferase n=1 Tax=Plasmodium reichenowi TaxID=5854 RepID=A0A151LHH9_PLARE|nr:met-10+ like protein, putative [Plasmodium reichenowi]KYN98431.1 met-10+ like protein, putative [Plasmodium reichenowi]